MNNAQRCAAAVVAKVWPLAVKAGGGFCGYKLLGISAGVSGRPDVEFFESVVVEAAPPASPTVLEFAIATKFVRGLEKAPEALAYVIREKLEASKYKLAAEQACERSTEATRRRSQAEEAAHEANQQVLRLQKQEAKSKKDAETLMKSRVLRIIRARQDPDYRSPALDDVEAEIMKL